ncbi:MAG: class II glutamine amidotransferase [Candidatus Thiodiazotropha sp.]
MCELLGMSANVPTDICFSFSGLVERGGRTGPHQDGWGIAFYEGKGCRTFHDPQASADSEIAKLIRHYPIRSCNVISHIRRANRGKICLENTHPFSRELWGRNWTFAHNGELKGIKKYPLAYYRPVGTTDSEHAFCWLMDQIRNEFPEMPRNMKPVWKRIGEFCRELYGLGIFNMLLCDSQNLYAFCATKLSWITRKAPFGKAQLIDLDFKVDFSKETKPDDVVTVIATQPLTDNEFWTVMETGELRIFRDGLTQCRTLCTNC